MLDTLRDNQVSGRPTGVETAAYTEAANVELQIALVEPDVVQHHVEAADPGPGEALLLVLDHVDPGGGGQVGGQEAEVTSPGTKVNNEVTWLGQLT